MKPKPNSLTPSLIRQLKSSSDASLQAAEGPITDSLAAWFASEFTAQTHSDLSSTKDAERREILHAAVRDWCLLRRTDHAAARLELNRERIRMQKEKHQRTLEAAAKKASGEDPDYKRPLTDEERLAIIAKVDEIIGIQPDYPVPGDSQQKTASSSTTNHKKK